MNRYIALMLVADLTNTVFGPRTKFILDFYIVRRIAEGQGKGTDLLSDSLLKYGIAFCPESAAQCCTVAVDTCQCS